MYHLVMLTRALLLILLFVSPGFAQGVDPSLLSKVGELGSTSMGFLLAMYWLRDSYARRVEETQRYANELKVRDDRAIGDAKRYFEALERAYTGKTVTDHG